jgi:hypothetical protein
MRFSARAIWLALLTLACAPPLGASTPDVHAYVRAVSEDLPQQVRDALPRIEGAPRRLLAARAYLRAGAALTERWSWSHEQIRSYQAGPEYRGLLDAVAAVQKRFETANPGYSLYANTEARSLDLQLARWNENATVKAAAQEVHRAVLQELRAGGYPEVPSAAHTERFVQFLRGHQPSRPVSLAAPGLSLHGRALAIDFQVVQGDRIVAGTSVATVRAVWERGGWAAKLNAAVVGSPFVGPLRSPNEPWHYQYQPASRQRE